MVIYPDENKKCLIQDTKIYGFDKDNKLCIFGFVAKNEIPNPKLIYKDVRGGSNDQILFCIPDSVSLESEIREATANEMLKEIDLQINRNKKLEQEKDKLIDDYTCSVLNFIIDTLNSSDIAYTDLKDSFQKSFPEIYSKHHGKINYCEDCKKYIIANEKEEEIYSEEYDDYIPTSYYVCPICGNNDLI